MNKKILHQVINNTFLDDKPDEWGIVIHNPNPQSVGVATTLTPAIIQQAVSKDLDLLVTHHDSWDFMLDEQTESYRLLSKHKISHIWCHEPLDKSDFGNAAALLDIIGCRIIDKITYECGRIGELPAEQWLSSIIENLEGHISERPCRIHDNGKPITRIASVPGGGTMVNYLVEALEHDVDLYITGETSLYLLEYATFRDVSVLVYSHNYSEIFGTQNLAMRIADHLAIKEIVRLDEPHY